MREPSTEEQQGARPAPAHGQRRVFQQPDGQGRVTLPARLLEFAGITREVTVIGVQDQIEIWDRAAWAEYLAHLEEGADATADELAT